MVEPYLRRSPLAHRGLVARAAADAGGAELRLGEVPHRCQIDLRGDAGDSRFTTALHGATGLRPPAEANSFATAGDLALLWLGPNEWLILGPGGRETEIAARLRDGLRGTHAAVIDVSEARTTIALAGPRARDLLAKGTGLDLHPRVFAAGRCAQTGLVGANVILRQTDDAPSFELLLLNSFADYLWTWLERAAAEYRWAIVQP